METSQIRQNYHRDCEAAINRMINMELFASYTYTSMVSFRERCNVLFIYENDSIEGFIYSAKCFMLA